MRILKLMKRHDILYYVDVGETFIPKPRKEFACKAALQDKLDHYRKLAELQQPLTMEEK